MGRGGRGHGANRLGAGETAGLAALIAVAALVRFATLDGQSFSDDELFTAWLVEMSFADMVSTLTDTEATPPLFYAAEWGSARVFGLGEVGMRLLPALAGTLTVAVVYAVGALGASRQVGFAAAALAAVNPFLVWYSQEARAYALLILFVALTLLCLVVLERSGRRLAVAGWAAFAAAALATHYFALFLIAPQAAWLIARGPGTLRARALAVAVPGLTGVPLMALALHQRNTVSDPGGLGDTELIERLAAIPKNFLVGFSVPAEVVVSGLSGTLAVVGLALAFRRNGASLRFAAAMGALAALGVAIPLALSPAGFDYLSSRNVVAALIPFVLLLGCGFAHGRLGQAALAGLVLISGATVIGVALDSKYGRRDWRGAADALGPAMTDRLLVFSPPFSNAGPFRVYFGDARLAARLPVRAREVALVALAKEEGFGPGAPRPPLGPVPDPPPGFQLMEDRRTDTYRLVRFRSARTHLLAQPELKSLALPGTRPVLVQQDGPG